MPSWLVSSGAVVAQTAAKAVLMYLVALLGLRIAHRRTLSQWTAIDFAAAVAIGAIVGRTAVASGEPFVVGAAALLTILAAHGVMTYARYNRYLAKLVDHRVRVLVAHGRLRKSQLYICGLTENDFLSQLRQMGHVDLRELRYVLYETKGDLTVVRETSAEPEPGLVRYGLEQASDWPPR